MSRSEQPACPVLLHTQALLRETRAAPANDSQGSKAAHLLAKLDKVLATRLALGPTLRVRPDNEEDERDLEERPERVVLMRSLEVCRRASVARPTSAKGKDEQRHAMADPGTRVERSERLVREALTLSRKGIAEGVAAILAGREAGGRWECCC